MQVYIVTGTFEGSPKVFQPRPHALHEIAPDIEYNGDDPAQVLIELRNDGEAVGKDWSISLRAIT